MLALHDNLGSNALHYRLLALFRNKVMYCNTSSLRSSKHQSPSIGHEMRLFNVANIQLKSRKWKTLSQFHRYGPTPPYGEYVLYICRKMGDQRRFIERASREHRRVVLAADEFLKVHLYVTPLPTEYTWMNDLL